MRADRILREPCYCYQPLQCLLFFWPRAYHVAPGTNSNLRRLPIYLSLDGFRFSKPRAEANIVFHELRFWLIKEMCQRFSLDTATARALLREGKFPFLLDAGPHAESSSLIKALEHPQYLVPIVIAPEGSKVYQDASIPKISTQAIGPIASRSVELSETSSSVTRGPRFIDGGIFLTCALTALAFQLHSQPSGAGNLLRNSLISFAVGLVFSLWGAAYRRARFPKTYMFVRGAENVGFILGAAAGPVATSLIRGEGTGEFVIALMLGLMLFFVGYLVLIRIFTGLLDMVLGRDWFEPTRGWLSDELALVNSFQRQS